MRIPCGQEQRTGNVFCHGVAQITAICLRSIESTVEEAVIGENGRKPC
jgi:hypothetical protein